jgi:hypothetical protein
MNWTNEKPKQEGWYWYRTDSHTRDHCASVEHGIDGKLHARIMCADFIVDNLNGEWSNTLIPMPEETT